MEMVVLYTYLFLVPSLCGRGSSPCPGLDKAIVNQMDLQYSIILPPLDCVAINVELSLEDVRCELILGIIMRSD